MTKTDYLTLPANNSSQHGSAATRFDLSDKAGLSHVRVEDEDWHVHARDRRRNRGKNRLKREVLVHNAYQEEDDAQRYKEWDALRCKSERALVYLQEQFKEAVPEPPGQGTVHAYSPYKVTHLW